MAERKGIGCIGATGIVIGGLVIALYAAWPSDKEMTAKRDATLANAPKEAVSPQNFVRAFAENEVAARARFDGKAVDMSGKVKSVREGNSNTIVIVFDAENGDEVSASVDGADRAKAESIIAGAVAAVHCASILDLLGVQVLAQCRLG